MRGPLLCNKHATQKKTSPSDEGFFSGKIMKEAFDRHTIVETPPYERSQFELRSAGQKLAGYLRTSFSEVRNPQLNPIDSRPWNETLPHFTRDLAHRLDKVRSHDDLAALIAPVVMRGVEYVSGGILSMHELDEGQHRGLDRGGTWPDAPDAQYWDPRLRSPKDHKSEKEGSVSQSNEQRKSEGALIRDIVHEALLLPTNASEGHVGRVLTMSLPALLAWSDLGRQFTPQTEIVSEHVDAVRRMLEAEQTGHFAIVTFGCEPYQYGFAPDTTTSHIRRSEFGSPDTLREDAIRGSFRGIRRILEPLAISGVETAYDFYTSAGNSWELIQRQVMPDTKEFYRQQRTPEEMLAKLQWWNEVIAGIGCDELGGSGIAFSTRPMEQEVVYPALQQMYRVLKECGMSMPDDPDDFCYNSQEWFMDHMGELNFINVATRHPNPRQFLEYFLNEDEWSSKHPEAYASDEHRIAEAALLAAFELFQYERINSIINSTEGIAVGVEIDEELITKTRGDQKEKQVPLLWGRPPRYTQEGRIGGVAHRQPWFYEEGVVYEQ